MPTIGGEVYFEGPYEQNCLVNAMALGLARADGLIRSAATGVGNALILFGASTGRDGIGGASVLASAELGEEDASKRPTVQVGDPFAEKKLLECSLELLDLGLLVALQDLGAAGLSSSSAEMASKGEVGLDIDVSKVPLREAGMEPWEIMISESQERMLCVAEPARVDEVLAVCAKWEVHGTVMGRSPTTACCACSTATRSSGRCPSRRSSTTARCTTCRPSGLGRAVPGALRSSKRRQRPRRTLSGCSRRRTSPRACRCFSSTTASCSRAPCAGPSRPTPPCSTLLRRRAIAVSIDGSGAVSPATRTLARSSPCSNAPPTSPARAPSARADELPDFGNPEKPHVAWQLTESIRGLADACRALDVPVVGGNVSLYNESGGGPIYPTPVIGMVGELPVAGARGPHGLRCARATRSASPARSTRSSPAPSSRSCAARSCRRRCRRSISRPCARAQEAIRDAVRSGDLHSAHDVAEGGFLVAVAECCLAAGWRVARARADGDALERVLFGESPGRGFVVSGSAHALDRLAQHVAVDRLGTVGGDALDVTAGDDVHITATLAQLREAHAALAPLFP